MITIPQLDPITTIADDDVIMITHSNGTTDKITGVNFKKAMAVDVVAENNMNSVTSNAVATNCEGKLFIQLQFGQDPISGTWHRDNPSAQLWYFDYSINVPSGYRFLFAAIGLGWTDGEAYLPILLDQGFVYAAQGSIRARTTVSELNGVLVPNFHCVFEKIN